MSSAVRPLAGSPSMGILLSVPTFIAGFGHGFPEEISAKARDAGGVSDDSVMGDCEGALKTPEFFALFQRQSWCNWHVLRWTPCLSCGVQDQWS